MKVLFLGQNPSNKNTSANAFIGSQSHKTIVKWATYLDISTYHLQNTSLVHGKVLRGDVRNDLNDLCSQYELVITLGTYASKALIERNIHHFSLPHPSGLNRQLNDHSYIRMKLKECESYIHENRR